MQCVIAYQRREQGTQRINRQKRGHRGKQRHWRHFAAHRRRATPVFQCLMGTPKHYLGGVVENGSYKGCHLGDLLEHRLSKSRLRKFNYFISRFGSPSHPSNFNIKMVSISSWNPRRSNENNEKKKRGQKAKFVTPPKTRVFALRTVS